MLLILDYDDTYTADPIFWNTFVKNALSSGHTVICCTFRNDNIDYYPHDNDDIKKSMGMLGVPIVFAAQYMNKWMAVEDAGYIPSNAIWIDDSPQFILRGSI